MSERSKAGQWPPTVQLFGNVFFDLVFSGLSAPPRPGTEVLARGLGMSPGGSANVAVALARLGLNVRLTTPFADDALGEFLRRSLAHEGIDLSTCPRVAGGATPITVSLADQEERAMVTYEEANPIELDRLLAELPRTEEPEACFVPLPHAETRFLKGLRDRFGWVFADVSWDPKEQWTNGLLEQLHLVDVFLPNTAEAVAYARCNEVEKAAEVLCAEGPLVVVKQGEHGALARERERPEVVRAPALATEAVDTTGAGDVFDAGFIFATLWGLPIEQRLAFAGLCAGHSVRYPGGSLSAPCWRDLGAWYDEQEDAEVRATYSFLVDILAEQHPERVCQRPCASMRYLDEHDHPRVGSGLGASR